MGTPPANAPDSRIIGEEPPDMKPERLTEMRGSVGACDRWS